MGLRQSQEQRQIIGQRMYQYMDILAMNMDEINRYVDDAMRDNPLIELLSPPEHFTHYSDWDAERQDAFDRYSQQSAGKTLEAFLLEQIASLKLDESARSAVVYIICSMDENGTVTAGEQEVTVKFLLPASVEQVNAVTVQVHLTQLAASNTDAQGDQ